MKYEIPHKIVSCLLAILVLFSTVSFTVEKHFCGDFLIDVAVFSDVEKCASETQEEALAEITKKSCCKDTIDVIQGQDQLIKTFDDLTIEQQQFVTALSFSYASLFKNLPKQVIPYLNYIPPKLVYDDQVIYEQYLI